MSQGTTSAEDERDGSDVERAVLIVLLSLMAVGIACWAVNTWSLAVGGAVFVEERPAAPAAFH